MTSKDHIKSWRLKIKEINSTGNCKNRYGKYFGGKMNKEDMIAYCEDKIKKLTK